MAGYVDKSLAPGEEIIRRGSFPFAAWLWAWLILVVLGIVIVGIVIFVAKAARMLTTEFAVTTQRVILKRGWLNRQTEELSVQSIEGVHLSQSAWERLWNYGSLVVTGTGEARIHFPSMHDPVGFRRAIESARAMNRDGVITEDEVRAAKNQ